MPKVEVNDTQNNITITLNGDSGDISAGASGKDGDLIVRNGSGTERIRLDGQSGSITARSAAMVEVFGVDGGTGEVILRGVNIPGQGLPRIRFQPADANVLVGGGGKDGDLVLNDADGKARIRLIGSHGHAWLGGGSQSGMFVLFPSNTDNVTNTTKATMILDGDSGSITLKDASKPKLRLIGSHGHAWLGGGDTGGLLVLFPKGAENVTDTSKATIFLDGDAGDIVLQNADCAEYFDIGESENVKPGTVMVIDEEGKLRQSQKAYDKRVAGVLSGAGDFKPAITLDKKNTLDHRLPVALVGKVYCQADAAFSSIEVGDLLTTSPTAGHAMKASDPFKAFGAVIGKALTCLPSGQGLIPILVALQ